MLTPEQDGLLARMCEKRMHARTIAAVLLITEDAVREAKKRLGLGKKPRPRHRDAEPGTPPPPPRVRVTATPSPERRLPLPALTSCPTSWRSTTA
jgi:hypothetical protein